MNAYFLLLHGVYLVAILMENRLKLVQTNESKKGVLWNLIKNSFDLMVLNNLTYVDSALIFLTNSHYFQKSVEFDLKLNLKKNISSK